MESTQGAGTSQVRLKFVCNNGEIADVLDVTDPKGRSDALFVKDNGPVKHLVATYGGRQYEIPRGDTMVIGGGHLPAIEVEVVDKPNKAIVRYQHVEHKQGAIERSQAYKSGWKQAAVASQSSDSRYQQN